MADAGVRTRDDIEAEIAAARQRLAAIPGAFCGALVQNRHNAVDARWVLVPGVQDHRGVGFGEQHLTGLLRRLMPRGAYE